MELCPKCKRLSAEINHYTGLLICYNLSCLYKEEEKVRPFDRLKRRPL